MGQKVHPYGFRLGFNKPWRSRWFAGADYAKLLREDLELKENLRSRLKSAGVSSIEVDRPGNKLRVTIRTSRPGIIIGRKGAEIEKLKLDLAKRTKREVFIDINEVHKPELDAQLVSESIAMQLEKRVAFRRAMRKAVDSALRFGCKGIKVRVSGRLNGAEIARSEWYLQGQLPLHTLRADIDYGQSEAHTTYGVIGIKCWLYKGEILEGRRRAYNAEPEPRRRERPDRERGGSDRGDRGGDRDRGPRRERPAQEPQSQPAARVVEGPAVQAVPGELPRRTGGPLMPPIAAPQGVAWKQEAREQRHADHADVEPVEPPVETAAAETPAPEPKPTAPEPNPTAPEPNPTAPEPNPEEEA
jgi:small subunit ribosomal protein S3